MGAFGQSRRESPRTAGGIRNWRVAPASIKVLARCPRTPSETYLDPIHPYGAIDMLEEALFFVLGGVLTWGYGRVDARRRAAVHQQTREQIAELKAVVEDTLARIGETRQSSPPAREAARTSDPDELTASAARGGLRGLGLESALRRLKAHLEEADG